MKILTPILCLAAFVAIGCFANETNHVTSETHEFRDKAGKLVGSYEDFFRGKDKIMMTTSSVNSQGKLALRSRTYFLHGDMVTTELAVRKDDKLDTILVYHPGKEGLEVFRRSSDGSVRPARTELLLKGVSSLLCTLFLL
ncbi:MAG: hypothetical protein WCH99_19265 [Verrucomicrobiota bacterium]